MSTPVFRGIAAATILVATALSALVPTAQATAQCPYTVTADQPTGVWENTSATVTFTLDTGGCQIDYWSINGVVYPVGSPVQSVYLGEGQFNVQLNVHYYGEHTTATFVCDYYDWWGSCGWGHYVYTTVIGWDWSNEPSYQYFKIDLTNPYIWFNGISGPVVDGNIITSAARLTESARDYNSGVASLTHRDGTGAQASNAYTEWWSGNTIDNTNVSGADGPHTITFRATDAAGNFAEDAHAVILDNTPPAVKLAFPSHNSVAVNDVKAETCTEYARVSQGGNPVVESPVATPTIPTQDASPVGTLQPDACAGTVLTTAAQYVPAPAQPVIGSLGTLPKTDPIPAGPAPGDPTGMLPPVVVGEAQTLFNFATGSHGGTTLPSFGTPTGEAQAAVGALPIPAGVGAAATPVAFENPMVISGAVDIAAIVKDQYAGTSMVQFIVDGQLRNTQLGGDATYHWTWNTSTDSDGRHTLGIRTMDRLGNVGVKEFAIIVASATKESTKATEWQNYVIVRNAVEQAPFTLFGAFEAAPDQAQAAVDAASADASSRSTTAQAYAGQRSGELRTVVGLP